MSKDDIVILFFIIILIGAMIATFFFRGNTSRHGVGTLLPNATKNTVVLHQTVMIHEDLV